MDFTIGLLIAQTVKTHLQKKTKQLINIVWMQCFVLVFNPFKLFRGHLGRE